MANGLTAEAMELRRVGQALGFAVQPPLSCSSHSLPEYHPIYPAGGQSVAIAGRRRRLTVWHLVALCQPAV